jgi:hypothetical protein
MWQAELDNKIIKFVSCVFFFAATPLDRRKPYGRREKYCYKLFLQNRLTFYVNGDIILTVEAKNNKCL